MRFVEIDFFIDSMIYVLFCVRVIKTGQNVLMWLFVQKKKHFFCLKIEYARKVNMMYLCDYWLYFSVFFYFPNFKTKWPYEKSNKQLNFFLWLTMHVWIDQKSLALWKKNQIFLWLAQNSFNRNFFFNFDCVFLVGIFFRSFVKSISSLWLLNGKLY